MHWLLKRVTFKVSPEDVKQHVGSLLSGPQDRRLRRLHPGVVEGEPYGAVLCSDVTDVVTWGTQDIHYLTVSQRGTGLVSNACVRYRFTFFTLKASVTGVDALPEVRDHP